MRSARTANAVTSPDSDAARTNAGSSASAGTTIADCSQLADGAAARPSSRAVSASLQQATALAAELFVETDAGPAFADEQPLKAGRIAGIQPAANRCQASAFGQPLAQRGGEQLLFFGELPSHRRFSCQASGTDDRYGRMKQMVS